MPEKNGRRHCFKHTSGVLPAAGRHFPAAAGGLLLTLAFPDTGWAGLAWVALAPLIMTVRNHSEKEAFQMGFTMGAAHFLSLIYWILPTLQTYGDLPFLLALPILLLLVCYLALYPAMFCLFLVMLPPSETNGISTGIKKWTQSLLFPVKAGMVWVGLEFLRAHLFTGFPWGLTGYALYNQTHLIQIADITGVYGISFLVIFVNATVAAAWTGVMDFKKSNARVKKNEPAPGAVAAAMISVATICVATVWGYGHHRLETISAAMEKAPRRSITVVQGNIPQAEKWDEAFKSQTVSTYCRLSTKVTAETTSDLIIWPETALPFYYTWDEAISRHVDDCIRKSGAWFLIGSPAFEMHTETQFDFFNRAYMLTPRAMVTGTYDKVHLVPFGEYVPFGNYLTFLDKLTSQAGDFSPGSRDARPLRFNDGAAGILICFEIIFPELSSRMVKNGADLLVTMTNDAWFGRSSAPLQHFSMAVFRAVETRRSVARAANTGISGFIDPAGTITATTPLFTEATLTGAVPALALKTFYTLHGDLFAWLCAITTLLLMWRRRHKIPGFSQKAIQG